ncbi:hypothetical protein pb186bvf_009626 [Paramecium bursaria]
MIPNFFKKIFSSKSQEPQRPLCDVIADIAKFNIMAKTNFVIDILEQKMTMQIKKANSTTIMEQLQNKTEQNVLMLSIVNQNRIVILDEPKFYELFRYLEQLVQLYKGADEDSQCQICMDAKVTRTLPCAHSFCDTDFIQWFIQKEKGTCPMCRNQLSLDQVQAQSFYIPSDDELAFPLIQQILEITK